MSQPQGKNVDLQQAQAFLISQFDPTSTDVELAGEGAWSRCYGFRRGTDELVIRFGAYLDDFQSDQRAAAYATPNLPIPQMLAVGRAFDGYYAISTRVYGIPLETVSASEWPTVVPSLVAALDDIRCVDISATTGCGGWDHTGNAPYDTWAGHLLVVGNDTPDRRTYGWRARLAESSEGEAAFTWGFDLLTQVASTTVPRYLIHSDLCNRNVLVDRGAISGVFDWGCSLYGDHLYDLAWFEFWAPWQPNLDIPLLRAQLERRWHDVGYVPADKDARLLACYLHIGLDHLAYNAYLGDWPTLLATAERMRVLASHVAS